MNTTETNNEIKEHYGFYDQIGRRVIIVKRGERTFEVWFPGMDRSDEGCIWTGNLDQLVYEEELEIRRVHD